MKKIVYISILTLAVLLISCKKEKNPDDKKESNEAIKEIAVAESLDTLKLVAWRSKLAWRGFALNKSHTGIVKIDSGYIALNSLKEIKAGEFFINMNSISVVDLKGEEKITLENHLKGTDPDKEDHFFNVTKYPIAKFVVTDNYKEESINYLEGNLTIKGVESIVEGFPIVIEETDGKLLLKAANFKIDRTDWGITYNSVTFFDDLKDKVIKDEMVINISAAFAINK